MQGLGGGNFLGELAPSGRADFQAGWVQKVNVTAAPGLSLSFPFCPAALVVRFLTKRFIGDYERNAGEPAPWEEAPSVCTGAAAPLFSAAQEVPRSDSQHQGCHIQLCPLPASLCPPPPITAIWPRSTPGPFITLWRA